MLRILAQKVNYARGSSVIVKFMNIFKFSKILN